MEFDLIHRYFSQPFSALLSRHAHAVPVGIGDDCAALQAPSNHRLYISTDTLVAGVHFFEDEEPSLVGWKALACNLSDLAASGAEPLGFTLCLSLPQVNHGWLTAFSQGLLDCATEYACPLIGGDTTGSGANRQLVITVGVMGSAPVAHTGFHRGHAQVGDLVWVSGLPGLARLGLLFEFQARGLLNSELRPEQLKSVVQLLAQVPESLKARARQALVRPQPKLELAKALYGLAHAAIDLSDGLSGDLAHISQASGVQLQINHEAIERLWIQAWPELEQSSKKNLLSTLCEISYVGGDDFELCWTASPLSRGLVGQVVGCVSEGQGVELCWSNGQRVHLHPHSFNHFDDGECS